MKKPNSVRGKIFLGVTTALLFASSASANSITVQLTPTGLGLPGEVNVGFSFVVNENLSLSAITRRGQVDFNGGNGIPGTILFTNDGAGVQSEEFKGTDSFDFPQFGGSKEISGVKKHKFESLVLEFSVPVIPTSVDLLLDRYDPSDDAAHLTLALVAGGTKVLLPDLIDTLFLGLAPSSTQLLIDLGDPGLAGLFSGIGPLTEIEVR